MKLSLDKINAKNISFKDDFVKRYSDLTDWEEFKEYSLSYLRRTIRVNTLKIRVNELVERLSLEWELSKVPWAKEGFWIKGERRDIGNLIEHSLGYFFVQEAASMLPPIAMQPKENETILDMCAAPGSKTTQIAQYMKNTGLLVANDLKYDRNKALGINIQRMGVTNTVTTIMEGRAFKGFSFDRILVDAPCSGTGTIRKSLKTLTMWNKGMVKRLSRTQKQLLETAFNNLKPGGIAVYSTCTLEPEENEGVVSYLLDKYSNAKIQDININIKRSKPVESFDGITFNKGVRKALRVWPQDNDTEGFFVAKIKKKTS